MNDNETTTMRAKEKLRYVRIIEELQDVRKLSYEMIPSHCYEFDNVLSEVTAACSSLIDKITIVALERNYKYGFA